MENFMVENTGIHILLVDDKKENLLALEDLLEKEGRIFHKAQSGNEALKMVLNKPIGMVLLDVQMPDMDGFEVAKYLKSNPKTKDIAIIFVTAISKEKKYALKGFDEGAVDYLYKPLDTNITRAKVNVFETLYYQQQALKSSLQQIAQMNKQLDDFVHIVSHDLKTPLNGILGLVEWVQEDLDGYDNETVKENLEHIRRSAENLSSMITGVLEYSKSSKITYKRDDIDLDSFISDIIKLILPPAHIRVELQAGLPVIKGDHIKLQQVLQNFIGNAVKYNDKAEGLVKISMEEKPNCYEFTISDNGPGIDPKNHQRIFQLFQTLNPISDIDSTGVGLTIVKSIVENQGGKIHVDSELGKGASFTFQWMK